DVHERTADQFIDRAAEQPSGGAAHLGEATLQVEGVNRVGRCCDEALVLGADALTLLSHAALIGDVAGNAVDADNAVIDDRRNREAQQTFSAVRPYDAK